MVHRPGMSRVQALVGLVIVALVVGLLLAVVAKVRSAADQMQCSYNLYQLGLGVHNYCDTHGALPPLTDQGPGALTGRGLPSAFALLIQHLEGTTLVFRPEQPADRYYAHSSAEFTWLHKGHPHTQYGGMANQVYRTFVDPADATARQLRDVPMAPPDGGTGYYATGSYAANGLVPWGTGTIAKAFPRGTGNTVLMGERPQVCRTPRGDEVFNLWGVGIYSPHMPAFACLTPADLPGLASTGQAAAVEPLPAEADALLVRFGRNDAAPGPPEFPTPLQRVRAGRPCDPRLPGGPHTNGMVVLMADGSARVLDWDTTPWAFWSACVPGAPPEGQ